MADKIKVSATGLSAEGEPARELTRATGRAVELSEGASRFLGRVFGGPLEQGLGIFEDWLVGVRFENMARISDRVRGIHAERGIEDLRPVSARLLVPYLDAATRESDEVLQDMWARLLANASDPNQANPLRRAFIGALEKLEPLDAVLLEMYAEKIAESGVKNLSKPKNWPEHGNDSGFHPNAGIVATSLSQRLGREVRPSEAELSMRHH